MKQTITIDLEVRDGYALKFNPETRTIEEVKKEPVRSKSWEEFCKNHPETIEEYYIGTTGRIFRFGGQCNRSLCPNHLATKEDAEGILALIQLTRLHDEWVGDWEPKTKSWLIMHSLNIVEVNEYWASLLSFPTIEMACEFFHCFKDLIEKAKKFI